MRKKISLIGAGNIGGTIAHMLSMKSICDIVLFDINEGTAKGKALDISQSACLMNFDSLVTGTSNYSDISGSDAIIITAGVPRKPGMSRDDLISINAGVIKTVAENVAKYASNAFVIIVTNPLDVMVHHFQNISKMPKNMVVGMAGVLDSSRFIKFLADDLGISASDIKTLVLGGHGDTMVPLVNYTTVAGVPLVEFIKNGTISQERLDAIVQRTRDGGAEIVGLLGNGSAFYSPAMSAIQILESFLFDRKRILPCAVHSYGEYGIVDLYVGLPCIIGANGVEKIIEVPLSDSEKNALAKSAASVKALIDLLPA